jgi:hypothetical protein
MEKVSFFKKLIEDEYSCYVFANDVVHNQAIVVNIDAGSESKSQYIYNFIEVISTYRKLEAKIAYFYRYEDFPNYELKFDFYGQEEIVDRIINDISFKHQKYYKLLNKKCYVRHFLKLETSIFEHNNVPEIIRFIGLYIRHSHYHHRYSDFGTNAFKVSIIGNPNIISPFIKRPLEFDFFHSWTTKFFYNSHSELYLGYDLDNYYGPDLVELILEKAFSYFFDNKNYVVENYDEHIDYMGSSKVVLPNVLNEITYHLSAKQLEFYY